MFCAVMKSERSRPVLYDRELLYIFKWCKSCQVVCTPWVKKGRHYTLVHNC